MSCSVFCHGYEVRNQRIGVLATGPMAVHQAMMFRLLRPHVIVLAHIASLTVDQISDLALRGITVVFGTVAEVLTRHDQLTGVAWMTATFVDLDALVVSSIVHARARTSWPLGLFPTDFAINGHVMPTRIETSPSFGATNSSVAKRVCGMTHYQSPFRTGWRRKLGTSGPLGSHAGHVLPSRSANAWWCR